MISFILKKLNAYSLKDILVSEIESDIYFFVKYLPGSVGYILRYLYLKIFSHSIKGMAFVQPGVIFIFTKNISIGNNFACNSNTYINGIGAVSIGDNVLIGPNVVISSGEHQIENNKVAVLFQPILRKPIIIEDNVWIAANVVVMPGVTISKGTVVGAGSIVTKSTERYSVVVGVPARKIKDRSF